MEKDEKYLTPEEKLAEPVTVLKLRPFVLNALDSIDVITVGELQQVTDDELLDIKQFGPKYLAETRMELQKFLKAMIRRDREASLLSGIMAGDPTPDTILERAAEVRKCWSDDQHYERAGVNRDTHTTWKPPTANLGSLGSIDD